MSEDAAIALTVLTAAEASELFGVSCRTTCYAKKAIRLGGPALRASLESGLISVWGALWAATHLSPAAQAWVVAPTKRGVVRQRLRVARRSDASVIDRLARKAGIGAIAEVPHPAVVPRMATVATAASRAAARATLSTGRRPIRAGP
jgi:hypothetical protein